jgi:hypothetical protein
MLIKIFKIKKKFFQSQDIVPVPENMQDFMGQN